jgi:hypothetical protein
VIAAGFQRGFCETVILQAILVREKEERKTMKKIGITRIMTLSMAMLCTSFAVAQIAKALPKGTAKPLSSVPAPAAQVPSAPHITVNSFPPVKCDQSHPGETERTRDAFTKGDSKMAKSVSAHVVKYAMQRFHLESVETPADISRAEEEVYSFLKWKLGNPTTITAQFVTAGYQHFDNAFPYEAAAALVGFSLPQETKPFALDQKHIDQLKEDAQKDGVRLEVYLSKKYGIPPDESSQVVQKLVEAAQASVSHLGINMPQSWAIDDVQKNGVLVMIGQKLTASSQTPTLVRTSAIKAVTR